MLACPASYSGQSSRKCFPGARPAIVSPFVSKLVWRRLCVQLLGKSLPGGFQLVPQIAESQKGFAPRTSAPRLSSSLSLSLSSCLLPTAQNGCKQKIPNTFFFVLTFCVFLVFASHCKIYWLQVSLLNFL